MFVIVWLDDISAGDAERVGGKGANLGECAQLGLPVPAGFCVTTDAYREATSGLSTRLRDDASQGNAAAARERILALDLPGGVEAAITDAYRRLGEPPVAVRSSATAEDLADASFAGQQDTYLGVRGIESVLAAVRACWASLWTDRAVDYRRQQGASDNGLALAVVIQTMVPADVAGVLFTRDPVSGDHTTMLASASYGLGESVVSALVTPDTFTLSRRPPAILVRQLGSKKARIDVAVGGGTTTSAVSPEAQAGSCLTDTQLLRLVDLGERVESHYRSGQDIEWAFVADELYLLQARPITTGTPPVRKHLPTRSRLETAMRQDLIEHFPGPFPLDLYAVHHVQGAVQDLMNAAGLRAAPASSVVAGDEDGVIRITIRKPRPSLRVPVRLPALFAKGLRHDPSGWANEEAVLRQHLDELSHRLLDPAAVKDDAVIAVVRSAVARVATITTDRFVHYNAPMIVHRALAGLLIKVARVGHEVTPEDLYAGVAYKTAEITAAISELAAAARAAGVDRLIAAAPHGVVRQNLAADPAGRLFRARVNSFLAAYGARTSRLYLPFSNRSWREDPESLYALLAATLRGAPLEQAPSDIAYRVEERLPPFLRRRWRTTTERLRACHVGREGTVYLIEEFFCVARVGMDEIARRLVDRQQLELVDDLRFLYFHEVEGALADARVRVQPVVARRRRMRGVAEAVWWDRGEVTDNARTLRGVPSSAGRAVGVARVIRSPNEFRRLQPGDILVCPYTDPTWTPLFALAAGIVADSGGPLSHAAIVAREYGIPAVLGVGNATTLPDGSILHVDGTKGIVAIGESPGSGEDGVVRVNDRVELHSSSIGH